MLGSRLRKLPYRATRTYALVTSGLDYHNELYTKSLWETAVGPECGCEDANGTHPAPDTSIANLFPGTIKCVELNGIVTDGETLLCVLAMLEVWLAVTRLKASSKL